MIGTGFAVTDAKGEFKTPAPQGVYFARVIHRGEEPHRYGVSEAVPLHENETKRVRIEIGGNAQSHPPTQMRERA